MCVCVGARVRDLKKTSKTMPMKMWRSKMNRNDTEKKHNQTKNRLSDAVLHCLGARCSCAVVIHKLPLADEL